MPSLQNIRLSESKFILLSVSENLFGHFGASLTSDSNNSNKGLPGYYI